MPVAAYYLHDPAAPKPNSPTRMGTNVLLECRGRLLLEQRWDCGAWGLPGGRLRRGEDEAHGIARELFEETGLRLPEAAFTRVRVLDDADRIASYQDGTVWRMVSGVDPVAPLQAGVVAQQLPQRDPGVPGDGKQRVTGPDGIGGTGILDHQRLPHYQLGRIWKLIVLDEPGHGDAVLIGQFIQGVSRPNHMDIHKKLLSSGFQINVMKSCLA